VSTPEPAPVAGPARKLGRIDYVFLALFAVALVGAFVWGVCGAPPVWNYLDYRSVIVDEERESRPGVVVQSGRIYDQARIDLPPGVELVLPVNREWRPALEVQRPISVKTRFNGKPGEVLILLETRISDGGHPPASEYLPPAGGRKVWKQLTGSVLTLDVAPGFTHLEGGVSPTVIFVVPPGQAVRHEPPTSAAFTGRGNDEQSNEAGWEFVLTRPLSRSRFQ
jgi:hypothetical protein